MFKRIVRVIQKIRNGTTRKKKKMRNAMTDRIMQKTLDDLPKVYWDTHDKH